MTVWILGAVFACYVALTSWRMRLALRASGPERRLREARILLAVVSLGVPLLVAVLLLL